MTEIHPDALRAFYTWYNTLTLPDPSRLSPVEHVAACFDHASMFTGFKAGWAARDVEQTRGLQIILMTLRVTREDLETWHEEANGWSRCASCTTCTDTLPALEEAIKLCEGGNL